MYGYVLCVVCVFARAEGKRQSLASLRANKDERMCFYSLNVERGMKQGHSKIEQHHSFFTLTSMCGGADDDTFPHLVVSRVKRKPMVMRGVLMCGSFLVRIWVYVGKARVCSLLFFPGFCFLESLFFFPGGP